MMLSPGDPGMTKSISVNHLFSPRGLQKRCTYKPQMEKEKMQQLNASWPYVYNPRAVFVQASVIGAVAPHPESGHCSYFTHRSLKNMP